ncbi:monovalent cation/H(+) antiporter subunit G [Flaviflexus huanghaiensis]|uniref:monovalent cation/H(+) antiporter subunit G n=1 Tax=Flaviflexus huanghaiensis TaxID=1111473 RepID=UPI0015F84F03|nr:monovalent cation/H(+) antiporter subunit G [Flaviflexus huanghaiensis]
MLGDILTALGGGLLIAGSALTLVAGIAVLRFRDLLSRQHAATKPQVLGLILSMIGMALIVRDIPLAWTASLVVALQLISSPISAHMIGRAGYRTGGIVSAELVVDELGEDIESTRVGGRLGPGATQ